VYFCNNVGTGQAEKLIVAFKIRAVVGKAFPAEVGFHEVFRLNHCAHGTIDYQDTLLQGLLQQPWSGFVTCHEDALCR
jgi:hypothetical protein